MVLAEIISLLFMFVIGAVMGSFACCQAWRIRYKELGKKDPGKWSICLSCGKRLSAKENIPIFSWIFQKGKCKKCGARIGKAEIFSELSLGAAFAAIGFALWPEFIYGLNNIPYLILVVLISIAVYAALTIFWILLVYDAKWGLLPTRVLKAANLCAVIYLLIRVVGVALGGAFLYDLGPFLLNLAGSVAILGGTYYFLYAFSKEKLVGGGDWLVALAISLILGDWWLALLTLFVANALGSIYGLILKSKKKEVKQIPFGPFLIIAFVVIYATQSWLSLLISLL